MSKDKKSDKKSGLILFLMLNKYLDTFFKLNKKNKTKNNFFKVKYFKSTKEIFYTYLYYLSIVYCDYSSSTCKYQVFVGMMELHTWYIIVIKFNTYFAVVTVPQ